MRTPPRPGRTPPDPLTLAASIAVLGCSDAPGTAPRLVPQGFDGALPVVVADTAVAELETGRLRSLRGVSLAAPAVSDPIDLGTLAGPGVDSYSLNFANAINDAGQVVGTGQTATGEFHAFLWTANRGMRDLGSLGGSGFSEGRGINAAGHVVGVTLTDDSFGHAFLWTEERGMQDLGTLGGCCSEAYAVNAAGHAVGRSLTASGETRAFLWTPEAGMRDLGTLGGPASEAWGINDAGHVVGGSAMEDGQGRAFLWTPAGGMQSLEVRPVLGEGSDTAYAINDAGHVVGTVEGQEVEGGFGVPRAFIWQPGTGAVLLPRLPGDVYSEARAVNDRGQAVGWSIDCDLCPRGGRPVLWTVRADTDGAPAVDRLLAVVLAPGVVPGLSGVWLRVRLTDPNDAGPWDWTIDWGDGVVHAPQDVKYTREFAFLRSAPYTTPGPHTIAVTARDPAGLTSVATTTTVP